MDTRLHQKRKTAALIERSSPTLATNNPLYRDQDRVIRDDPQLAADLFRRLRPHLPERMGPLRLVALNDRLRFYRYRSGQRFEPHMDHWYRPSDHQITLHTVLAYFNDDFKVGETVFQEQLDRAVTPKAGMVAVFQHKLRHEGRPVLAAPNTRCAPTSSTRPMTRSGALAKKPSNQTTAPLTLDRAADCPVEDYQWQAKAETGAI